MGVCGGQRAGSRDRSAGGGQRATLHESEEWRIQDK